MKLETILLEKTLEVVHTHYHQTITLNQIVFQKTKPEFDGDLTLLVFPLVKLSKQSPEETGTVIGKHLQENAVFSTPSGEKNKLVSSFNIVKGFLNLVINDAYWIQYLIHNNPLEVPPPVKPETVMVEFSSPNTNKPLHLGHIRNNLLGAAVSNILKASGRNVIRVNLVNDRGVHICKSMLAWKKWGKGETPQSSGIKGDHLVGNYYVEFDRQLKIQQAELKNQGKSEEEIEKNAPLLQEVQHLLSQWEAGEKEVVDLWKKMNSWVYDGFSITYTNLGIEFEKTYYESNTYLLGKKMVEEGIHKNIFVKKPDGSVWVDLTAEGMDEKLLLRSNGTSVYITQDLGTAIERQKEFHFNKLVYVVGNEQDYHFKVLFLTLKKLGYAWAEKLHHLSYGMVDLPSGKMKSREGTVVDADDIMQEMINTAKQKTNELGKANDLSPEEATTLYHTLGMAALKYYILKVDPKKRMLFNPEESIDFNGNTGPFIQYTYARIQSLVKKAGANDVTSLMHTQLHLREKRVIQLLHDYEKIIHEAADTYNPGQVANYVYELAKEYNQFYHECPLLKANNEQEKIFRKQLSQKTGEVIKRSLNVLGIEVPERM